jgi:hypothetical protein
MLVVRRRGIHVVASGGRKKRTKISFSFQNADLQVFEPCSSLCKLVSYTANGMKMSGGFGVGLKGFPERQNEVVDGPR